MNRIDRLNGIIIFLQGRQQVTVEELSSRYDISARTVYRDLKALQETGVPIGLEPGKGYFIVKGYHLPPVMFSRGEATSLLAGQRMMQKWNGSELETSYQSALDKIRAVLPPDDKNYFESLDQHIKSLHYSWPEISGGDNQIFASLHNLIFKQEMIEIEYLPAYQKEKTSRKVEPLGLLLMGNHWYLAGWCRLRNDYRMFRLDRIHSFKTSGIKIENPSEHTLKKFFERNLHKEKDLHEVVVCFDLDTVRYVGDQKYVHGWAWEEEVAEGINMTFLCAHPEYLSRWLLMWGNGVRVIKSESIKKRVKELAEEIFRHHK